MTKILLCLSLFVLMIYSCEPKKISYEDSTKWYSDCKPHPKYHPGDEYATESGGIDETLCIEECDSRFNCRYESSIDDSRRKYFKDMKSCSNSLQDCKFACIEKGHPIGDIAEHVEGGYYSDGSYYAMCKNPFENIHPTKDKYKKTKWQKDRDECIKLTTENVKAFFSFHKYYRECLIKRGYSIKLYLLYPLINTQ